LEDQIADLDDLDDDDLNDLDDDEALLREIEEKYNVNIFLFKKITKLYNAGYFFFRLDRRHRSRE
jgi:hypothetical protein